MKKLHSKVQVTFAPKQPGGRLYVSIDIGSEANGSAMSPVIIHTSEYDRSACQRYESCL